MITLYHIDHSRDPALTHRHRLPTTDPMALLLCATDGLRRSCTAARIAAADPWVHSARAHRLHLATTLFLAGGYVRVALIDSDDLVFAYQATQRQGRISWTQQPAPALRPLHQDDQRGTDLGDFMLRCTDEAVTMFCVDSDGFTPVPLSGKILWCEAVSPGWRTQMHPNGARVWAADGTLLDANGNCSIFDDVDA